MDDSDTVHLIAGFLKEWTPMRDDAGPVHVRCRVGRVKREAKTWAYQPIPVTNEDGMRVAAEIARRLNTERRRGPALVFVEIMPTGGTKPLDCLNPPLTLGAAEDDDEGEGDDGAPLDPSRMLQSAMTALISTSDIIERSSGRTMQTIMASHDSERSAFMARVNHLEATLQKAITDQCNMAVQLAEREKKIAVLEATGGNAGNTEMLTALLGALPGVQASASELLSAMAVKMKQAAEAKPPEPELTPEQQAESLVQGCAALFSVRPDLITDQYRTVFATLAKGQA